MAFAGLCRGYTRTVPGGGYAEGAWTIHKSMDRLLPHHDRQHETAQNFGNDLRLMDVLNVSVTLATERPERNRGFDRLQAIAMQLQQTTRRRERGGHWSLPILFGEGNMMDIQDGQRVKVSKNPACSAPVYRQGGTLGRISRPARSMRSARNRVDVNWSGYYHQLRAEGVIIVESLAMTLAANSDVPFNAGPGQYLQIRARGNNPGSPDRARTGRFRINIVAPVTSDGLLYLTPDAPRLMGGLEDVVTQCGKRSVCETNGRVRLHRDSRWRGCLRHANRKFRKKAAAFQYLLPGIIGLGTIRGRIWPSGAAV